MMEGILAARHVPFFEGPRRWADILFTVGVT